MIIQCEQCQTKFRLDDAKIKGRGVKVRCSKCRHVFLVHNEEPQPETAFSEVLGQYGETAAERQPVADTPMVPGEFAVGAGTGLAAGQETPGALAEADFSLPQSMVPETEEQQPSPAVPADEFDFSFDVADADTSQDTVAIPAAPVEGEKAAGVEEPFDFPPVSNPTVEQVDTDDFTIDFGELNSPQEPVSGTLPVHAGATQGHDTFNLDFDNLLGEESPPAGGRAPSSVMGFGEEIFSAASSHSAKDGDGFGGLDFSDLDLGELPSPAAQGGTSPSGKESRQSEPSVSADSFILASPGQEPSAEETEELPPLTISSRRKGASFFPAAVTVVAIIIVVIVAGIGFFVVSGPETVKKMGLGFITTLTGGEVQDEGKISLGKVTAEFVANKEAGELFVIRGETVNNYNKPRASIQVKATLLGATGQPILNKPAYCGNSLTKEQLETLPLAKIEEVMNNQFGDSLSNLGVQPGKSIPFVVVFANVPKDAVDFSVTVAGSTVAAK